MSKYPTNVVVIKVPLSVGVVIGIVSLGLILSYCLSKDQTFQKDLDFIGKVLAGSGTVYAAAYAGSAFRANVIRDKVQRAFEMLASQNSTEFIGAFDHLNTVVQKHSMEGHVNWMDEVVHDPELERHIRMVLSSFEDMATAVREGHVDERTIYLANARIMPWCRRRLISYIEHVRQDPHSVGKQTKDHRARDYMGQLERLCLCWEDGDYVKGGTIEQKDRV